MDFDYAYQKVRGFEGGAANNPSDRGGPTLYGVSSRFFPKDYANIEALDAAGDVAGREEYLRNFYKNNFWDKINADELSPDLALQAFDAAVHHGPSNAKKLLKQASGDPAEFINLRQNMINNIVEKDPSQEVFAQGWNNRIDALRNEQQPDFSAQAEPLDFSGQAVDFSPEGDILAPSDMADPIWYETLGRQALQGSTFGFADEATDRLGAFLASKVTGVPYEELLKEARATTQDQLAADMAVNPGTAILGNIAGGVLTGGVAAGGLKAVNPQLAGKIGTLAAARPNTAAFITGAGSGGLYGAGQSEGPLSDRLADAGTGAAIGGPLGVGGGLLARGGANVARSIGQSAPVRAIKRAGQAVGGALDDFWPSSVANQADDLIAPAVQSADNQPITPMSLLGIDENGVAQTQVDRVIPLTKGVRDQNVVQQRLEEQALKFGSEKMKAVEAAQQNAAYKPFVGMLGEEQGLYPVDINARVQNEAERVAQMVRDQYDVMGRNVTAAYKRADETGALIPVDTYKNLADRFRSIYQGNLGEFKGKFPAFEGAIDELDTLTKRIQEKGLNASTMNDLEMWKKTTLNTIRPDIPTAPKNAAGMLREANQAYESLIDDMAENSLIMGDDTAIDAFRKARGLASQKFKFYESNEGIQKILDGRDLKAQELVNIVFGVGRATGGGKSSGIVQTMLDNASEEMRPEMLNAMKQGAMAKILSGSVSNVPQEGNVSRNLIAFDRLRNNITEVMRNKEFFETVFNEEERGFMRQFYEDARLLAGKQSGAVNNSNTGIYQADLMTGFAKLLNNPITKRIYGINKITDGMQEFAQRKAAEKAVGKIEQQSLAEFPEFMDMLNQLSGRPAYYGAISANAIGPDGILRITVRPSDKNMPVNEEAE